MVVARFLAFASALRLSSALPGLGGLGSLAGSGGETRTSVRLAEAARDIEAETGVPITSSNHAMAWHALRLAGVDDVMPQWGRLFEAPLA